MMKNRSLLIAISGVLLIGATGLVSCNGGKEQAVTVVDLPDTTSKSMNYVSSRAPLLTNPLIKLPVTAIQPKGWARIYLERQREGLTGKLGAISGWLQKENNAWLSKDGNGEYGWEEVPYWLKGYANIGYILRDKKMIAEANVWLESVLNSQRPDGNFGPVSVDGNGAEDFWPKMIMMYCLQSYYEYSGDERVVDFMKNYFRYQLNYPEDKFIRHYHYWQGFRTGDNLHSALWLYNITGEDWLLELAGKIHKNSSSWENRSTNYEHGYHGMKNLSEWYSLLPDWHNVNIAQGFREPATYYQMSKNHDDLQASYDVHRIVRQYFGQVPGGMFGGDEISRPGYSDPRQGVETCGLVEEMNSDQHMLRITGDLFWADQAEDVAFNSYPAAVMPDFKSLRYITSPNMVLSDAKDHSPGIYNKGPFLMMNPFSSRCCQHNHAQGWPYYVENLWMATPDNGIAAVVYAASEATVKVGDGVEVKFEQITNYPFEEKISFVFHGNDAVRFPLYLRIPGWCDNAAILINGEKQDVEPLSAKYLKISRTWTEGDIVDLILPMKISVRKWERNKNSVSVNYGPLTFSLKIGEEYIRKDSDQTAIWDSKWQKGADIDAWPSFEIHPSTPWNFGLVINAKNPEQSFKIEKMPWPENDFPFTQEDVPLKIIATGRQIKDWQIDEHGLCGVLKESPVKSHEPEKVLTLIPMGAARLRISSFPIIGNGPDAKEWTVQNVID